jgi:enolase
MAKINNLIAREILDSRGSPTVEVDCLLEDGSFGRASVPSGASTGSHEAVELRDQDKTRYNGQGVTKAVGNVNGEILASLKDKDSSNQSEIDQIMIDLDGTSNKGRLGANAILGVSLAVFKASAVSSRLPAYEYLRKTFSLSESGYILPTPMMNVLNGGKHALNSSDFQEYMIVPHAARSFADAVRMGSEVFHTLKSILADSKQPTGVGDEGGFAPSLPTNTAPLDVLIQAVEKAGYKPNEQISFAIDVAASEFYKEGHYELARENKKLTSSEMTEYITKMVQNYPLLSCEDILSEDDWDAWKQATTLLHDKTQLVGDDLFVTNTERLKKGIDLNVANSILVKLNQIGTLTETVLAVEMAKKAGYTAIISHRSGETEDTTIADIAVGLNCGQIKTGSLSRSERVAKYNQLIRIEQELGSKAQFLGKSVFAISK